MPRVIYNVESKLNGRIRVVEVGSTRKIFVGNFIQSINSRLSFLRKTLLGTACRVVEKKELPKWIKFLYLEWAGELFHI
jgi:transcription antitermination factor NusA-like protein